MIFHTYVKLPEAGIPRVPPKKISDFPTSGQIYDFVTSTGYIKQSSTPLMHRGAVPDQSRYTSYKLQELYPNSSGFFRCSMLLPWHTFYRFISPTASTPKHGQCLS